MTSSLRYFHWSFCNFFPKFARCVRCVHKFHYRFLACKPRLRFLKNWVSYPLFVSDVCRSTEKYLEKDFDTKAPFSLALSCRLAAWLIRRVTHRTLRWDVTVARITRSRHLRHPVRIIRRQNNGRETHIHHMGGFHFLSQQRSFAKTTPISATYPIRCGITI